MQAKGQVKLKLTDFVSKAFMLPYVELFNIEINVSGSLILQIKTRQTEPQAAVLFIHVLDKIASLFLIDIDEIKILLAAECRDFFGGS